MFLKLVLKLFIVKQRKYLIINKHNSCFYLVLPDDIKVSKVTQFLFFESSQEKLKSLNVFCLTLYKYISYLEKPIKKKLLLKGLGLRATLSLDKKYLELKLGFSKIISVFLPKELSKITCKKNSILFESSNLLFLGNFIYKIRLLKQPNIYKGTGIKYKNEKIILKPFKKK